MFYVSAFLTPPPSTQKKMIGSEIPVSTFLIIFTYLNKSWVVVYLDQLVVFMPSLIWKTYSEFP